MKALMQQIELASHLGVKRALMKCEKCRKKRLTRPAPLCVANACPRQGTPQDRRSAPLCVPEAPTVTSTISPGTSTSCPRCVAECVPAAPTASPPQTQQSAPKCVANEFLSTNSITSIGTTNLHRCVLLNACLRHQQYFLTHAEDTGTSTICSK